MDLLDESKLLQNLSDRYGLSLLSKAREEVQNHENPALTKYIYLNEQKFCLCFLGQSFSVSYQEIPTKGLQHL